MEPHDEPLMVEAAAWVARLRAGRIRCAPRGGDVLMDRGRLRTTPRCVIQIEHEFVAAHREQLKVIAKLPRPKPQVLGPESQIAPTSGSDVESRVAPLSRSDWPKDPLSRSDRVTPEPYGPKPSDPEPVIVVQGYRITEHDVRAMLASYGDEELRRYDAGELSRHTAYRQARTFYTHSLRMGLQVAIRGSAGRVFLFPPLRIPRALSTTPDPSTDF